MTYFECINLLKEITKETQNEVLLEKLNNADIIFYNDVKYRFAIHLINTIKVKETKAFDKFLSAMTERIIDLPSFSLEAYNLKKELTYLNRLATSKIIPEECRKDIFGVYENIIKSNSDFIEKLLNEYYQEDYIIEYYNILNRKEEKL